MLMNRGAPENSELIEDLTLFALDRRLQKELLLESQEHDHNTRVSTDRVRHHRGRTTLVDGVCECGQRLVNADFTVDCRRLGLGYFILG